MANVCMKMDCQLPKILPPVDTSTVWGQVPANPMQVTNAFSNDPADRPYQDVGYDGLTDTAGKTKKVFGLSKCARFISTVSIHQFIKTRKEIHRLIILKTIVIILLLIRQTGILGRYKNFNNPQGNSPIC